MYQPQKQKHETNCQQLFIFMSHLKGIFIYFQNHFYLFKRGHFRGQLKPGTGHQKRELLPENGGGLVALLQPVDEVKGQVNSEVNGESHDDGRALRRAHGGFDTGSERLSPYTTPSAGHVCVVLGR